MKKYGVVSSFDTLCGNATYSEAIANGLSKSYEVIKIDVPTRLQRRYLENDVAEIIRQVKDCDFINIQMELGLYGPDPTSALSVLKRIISSSKAFKITMHRMETVPGSIIRLSYNQIKRGGLLGLPKMLSALFVQHKVFNTYKQLVKHVVKNNGIFIVHTRRESNRIKQIDCSAQLLVYPIVWPESDVQPIDLSLHFDKKRTVLGLFGFVSEYKNYLTVIDGLANEDVNVFIAGGTHPQSPIYGKISGANKSYIRRVADKLAQKKWSGRGYIQCAPSDEALIQYIKSVDIVCVPYAETGQSGSGIASLAIQFGKSVIFADTHCTTELKYFLKGDLTLSDADAPFGFASAVKRVLLTNPSVSFDGYDFEGLLKVYDASART